MCMYVTYIILVHTNVNISVKRISSEWEHEPHIRTETEVPTIIVNEIEITK